MNFSKLPQLWQSTKKPAGSAAQAPTVRPFTPVTSEQAMASNPFMLSVNPNHQDADSSYGVNRPLPKAAFLGYWNDKPLYGGNRLFLLY